MNSTFAPDGSFSTAPDGTILPSGSSLFGFLPAAAGTVLLICALLVGIGLLIGLVMYIFQAIGIMKMHKNLGLKGGWMAFLPLVNYFAFGKVAQQYIKQNGKKSAKFSVIFLVFGLLNILFSLLMGFFVGIEFSTVVMGMNMELVDAMLVLSLITEVFYFIFMAVYLVFYYIALWRIYAIFSNQSATLLLVLSIVFTFLQPFVIFAIRNREPACVETKEEPVLEAVPIVDAL